MLGKTFLLGVGCQKGGTTWLHKHLNDHPQCDMGFVKEYHALNVHFRPEDPYSRYLYRTALDEIATTAGILRRTFPDRAIPVQAKLSAASKRLQFFNDLGSYADYFAALSLRDHIRLVGDITPAYATLSAPHFAQVRRMLEKRGLRVKIVFLMRDPIDRVYSFMRMLVKNRSVTKDDLHLTAEELFARDYAKEEAAARTQYDRTIEEIEKVFLPNEVYYDFYETMFDTERARQLSDFLEIDSIEPRLDLVVNESAAAGILPIKAISQARDYYGSVYDYCMTRFGQRHIMHIWKYAAT